MKSVLAMVAISVLLTGNAYAAPMTGDSVTLSYGTYQTGNGGEFLLTSSDASYQYITFCLERNEYFNPGYTYIIESVEAFATNGGVDDKDDVGANKDYISNATKWLMNEYIFNYDTLYESQSPVSKDLFAGEVQNAIWFFEDELTTANALASYVLGLGYSAAGYDPYFLNNILVANIVDGQGTPKQSQLFASPVPEPATMLLFGSGLVGLAALRRKKQVA